MIRRIGLALTFASVLLIVLAEIQRLDDDIEAGEFHQITQLQRGN
jgi:hypothetical protein